LKEPVKREKVKKESKTSSQKISNLRPWNSETTTTMKNKLSAFTLIFLAHKTAPVLIPGVHLAGGIADGLFALPLSSFLCLWGSAQ
jgi:hypothetical protein